MSEIDLSPTCDESQQYSKMAGRFSTSEVLESKVLPGVIEAYPDFIAMQTKNEDEVLRDFTVMIDEY